MPLGLMHPDAVTSPLGGAPAVPSAAPLPVRLAPGPRPGLLVRVVLGAAMGVLGLGVPLTWWLAGRPAWWAALTALAVLVSAATLTICVALWLWRGHCVARPGQLLAAMSLFRFAVALAVMFAGHVILALEVLGLVIGFLATYVVLGVQLAWLISVALRRRPLGVVSGG